MIPKPNITYDELYWGEIGCNQFEFLNDEPYFGRSEKDTRWTILAAKCEKELNRLKKCEFCGHNLIEVETLTKGQYKWEISIAVLKWCENCRHWIWYSNIWCPNNVPKGTTWTFAKSKARDFDKSLPQSCEEELAQYFRRHPNYFHSINPKDLEKFVASVFKANYNQSEVIHVGKPNDGGVDVIFIDCSKCTWLIQVKRRENPNYVEGFSTIQNLAGTLLINNKFNGIVVTTADHFSIFAQRAIEKLSLSKYTVNLVDRGILNKMISPLLPREPWLKLIKENHKPFAEIFKEKVTEARKNFFKSNSPLSH